MLSVSPFVDIFFFPLQERHENLEKMGVSVQTSGIKVEKGKCFLVNLNADPSLNEMLVYYLKVRLIQEKCLVVGFIIIIIIITIYHVLHIIKYCKLRNMLVLSNFYSRRVK